jgi:hypothetical protein
MKLFFYSLLLALLLPFQAVAKDSPEALLKQLPETLGDCQRGELQNYGDPRLGWSIAYNDRHGMVITVYAYDQGAAKIADGISDRIITDSFASARRDIHVAMTKSMYSDVQPFDDGKATIEGMDILFARYHLTFAKGEVAGKKAVSALYIFGAHDEIIKIRATAPADDEPHASKVLAAFLPALVKSIQRPPSAPSL